MISRRPSSARGPVLDVESSSPFAGMNKLRAEVSELLETIEARHNERLSRAQSVLVDEESVVPIFPSPVSRSPVKRNPGLHASLLGLRGALREAERRNAALSAENASLGSRLSAVERELETRRLVDRCYAENRRMQRIQTHETAELRREIARLKDERLTMINDINALMNILRPKVK